MNEIEKNEIRSACYKIAMLISSKNKKIHISEIEQEVKNIEATTNDLVKISIDIYDRYEITGCKVDTLIRAIDYMEVHAIPVYNDYLWFDYGLSTLIELVCPNYGTNEWDFEYIKKDLIKRLNGKV